MFLIAATKTLADDTNGFRYNLFGIKGLVRKRKHKSNGFHITQGKCMKAIHMGKVTVYVETKLNKETARVLRHFAG